MVPDIAAFADGSPGYPIVCSNGVQGCTGSGQSIAFVGGTSGATPLVAGMIALWNQQAHNQGLRKPGFVAPLLTTLAQLTPQAFTDLPRAPTPSSAALAAQLDRASISPRAGAHRTPASSPPRSSPHHEARASPRPGDHPLRVTRGRAPVWR